MRRGKGLKIANHNVRQVIFAPRGKRHSEKPQQVHEGLERLYGDVRRLELFGRRERPGWKVWGNQVEDQPPEVLPAATRLSARAGGRLCD
jgi:N6-adenosine-specific RNA methylase IME4